MNFERISNLAPKVWRITSLIGIFIWAVITFLTYTLILKFTALNYTLILIITFIPLLFLIYFILRLFIRSTLFYRSWMYLVNEQMIILNCGIIFKSSMSIPINRIQYINTSKGPILEKYNLMDITIFTAGGSHKIPCLNEKIAIDMKENLTILAERSRNTNGI